MENIYFLILIAFIGLVRWLVQTLEKKRNAEAQTRQNPPSSAVPAKPAAETEEERVRRFFEALGVPSSATPPRRGEARKVITPKAAPKRAILPVDPFPVRPVVVAQPRRAIPSAPPPPEKSPLPTLETTVLKKLRSFPKRVESTTSDFEVHVIDERAPEGARLSAGAVGVFGPEQTVSSLKGIAARFATAEGLRDAIIVREILGPPRSMQL